MYRGEVLKGLLGLAEQAGHATPDGVQQLLYNYRWDADLVRDDLGNSVSEHLGDAGGG